MKPITVLSILLLCLTFIGVRHQVLDSHFTHIDDLIPSAHILATPEDPSEFSERLDIYLEKRGHDLSESASNIIQTSYPVIRPFVVAYSISLWSTYAPGQFLLTSLLVNQDQDYEEIIYWSRFPSFLCATLSLIILIMLYREFFRSEELPYLLVGISLISFSWMHIIYSIFSGSYAAGILAILLSFLLFFKTLSKSIISNKESFILGVSLSGLMFLNYQLVFFIPGFYLGLLHSMNWSLTRFLKSYLISIVTVITSFSVLYFVFLSKWMGRGVGYPWETDFIFNLPSEGIFEAFRYCMVFFLKNTYLVFKSIVGFANFEWMIVSLFTFICILLFLTGIVSLVKSRISKERSFGIFLSSVLGVWFCLVILQFFALSPDRHSLVLLTIILFYVPIGLKYFVIRVLNNNTYGKYIACFALVFTIIIPFSIDYGYTYNERKNKFYENEIQNLSDDYDLTHIYAYGSTWNLGMMKFIRENFTRTSDGNEPAINYVKKTSMNPVNVLFISHRAIKLDDEIITRFYKSNNINMSRNRELIEKKEIESKTEFDYSNIISNGTNSLYYYVYRISDTNK